MPNIILGYKLPAYDSFTGTQDPVEKKIGFHIGNELIDAVDFDAYIKASEQVNKISENEKNKKN